MQGRLTVHPLPSKGYQHVEETILTHPNKYQLLSIQDYVNKTFNISLHKLYFSIPIIAMRNNPGSVLTTYILIKCELIFCIVKLFSNQVLALIIIIINIRLKAPNICIYRLFSLDILCIDK